MRTLYYVNAGASWFGFYLDEGALALANDGARFNSFGAVLYGPASTISISLRNANRKDPARTTTTYAGNQSVRRVVLSEDGRSALFEEDLGIFTQPLDVAVGSEGSIYVG